MTAPPPDPDLTGLCERLRELLAKATPGPWHVQPYWTQSGTPNERVFGMLTGDDDMATGVIDEKEAQADSLSYDLDLIAAMHEALPDLLTALETLSARLVEARGVVEPFAKMAGPINGEHGRITYLEQIEGKDGTGELYLGSHFGTTAYEVMYADDFRRAASWLAGEEG